MSVVPAKQQQKNSFPVQAHGRRFEALKFIQAGTSGWVLFTMITVVEVGSCKRGNEDLVCTARRSPAWRERGSHTKPKTGLGVTNIYIFFKPAVTKRHLGLSTSKAKEVLLFKDLILQPEHVLICS